MIAFFLVLDICLPSVADHHIVIDYASAQATQARPKISLLFFFFMGCRLIRLICQFWLIYCKLGYRLGLRYVGLDEHELSLPRATNR